MKLRALLIDDITEARNNLRRDIADWCPDIEIIGEADGVISGAKEIRKQKPDLVFLDIQMQDGSGFDLLDILGEMKLHVIFTTASDAFAVKAFRYAAVDYLLKPIDPDELKNAVAKINNQSNSNENLSLLKQQLSSKKQTDRIALHTLEKIHVVTVDEIIHCESDDNYTRFYFQDKSKLLVTKTLKEFDELLSPLGFLRVHQSHLINLKQVKEFIKGEGGYLIMKDGSNIPVSTRKKQEVIEKLID
ncbi:MAG TPA: LytTR family DNA-binding domain-containing protein [Flavobacteriales bacterium]|nr:LytTR family DNA-binding domain-containing protein [Flavobacteriales bacterium]HPH82300.1 LytTR family DNA-binding domain-containing protein [Flavobacteriales bacterium]